MHSLAIFFFSLQKLLNKFSFISIALDHSFFFFGFVVFSSPFFMFSLLLNAADQLSCSSMAPIGLHTGSSMLNRLLNWGVSCCSPFFIFLFLLLFLIFPSFNIALFAFVRSLALNSLPGDRLFLWLPSLLVAVLLLVPGSDRSRLLEMELNRDSVGLVSPLPSLVAERSAGSVSLKGGALRLNSSKRNLFFF